MQYVAWYERFRYVRVWCPRRRGQFKKHFPWEFLGFIRQTRRKLSLETPD
jgi:hypothetical protein